MRPYSRQISARFVEVGVDGNMQDEYRCEGNAVVRTRMFLYYAPETPCAPLKENVVYVSKTVKNM